MQFTQIYLTVTFLLLRSSEYYTHFCKLHSLSSTSALEIELEEEKFFSNSTSTVTRFDIFRNWLYNYLCFIVVVKVIEDDLKSQNCGFWLVQAISYLLATGAAAGFGLAVDLNRLPGNENDSPTKDFLDKANASASLLLMGFLFSVASSVFSSLSLQKRI